MTKNEAMEILSFHSCRNKNVDDPRWEYGFVGRLRPTGGTLNEDNFIQIMESIRLLKDELSAEKIDKNLVYDVMGIIHLTRVWCTPYISAGNNNNLEENERMKLMQWIDIIENTMFYLLDGADDDIAFMDYDCYLHDSSEQFLKAELLRML